MTTEPDYARLAQHVKSRRNNLHLSLRDLAALGGPSTVTTSRIEQGKLVTLTPSTLSKLDQGLDWVVGSAADVLHGGEPRTIGDPGTAGEPIPDSAIEYTADLDSVTLTIEAVLRLNELTLRLSRQARAHPDDRELAEVSDGFDTLVDRMLRRWIIVQLEHSTRSPNLRVLEQLHLRQYPDRAGEPLAPQDQEDLAYTQWLAGRLHSDDLDARTARRFAARLKRATKPVKDL